MHWNLQDLPGELREVVEIAGTQVTKARVQFPAYSYKYDFRRRHEVSLLKARVPVYQ